MEATGLLPTALHGKLSSKWWPGWSDQIHRRKRVVSGRQSHLIYCLFGRLFSAALWPTSHDGSGGFACEWWAFESAVWGCWNETVVGFCSVSSILRGDEIIGIDLGTTNSCVAVMEGKVGWMDLLFVTEV